MIEEIRRRGRAGEVNYYDNPQADSVVWSIVQMDSNANLTNLMNIEAHRRDESIIEKVKDAKPGWFGNNNVKALFDKAVGLLEEAF